VWFAGIIAKNDRETGNPNVAAAGINGRGPGSLLGVVDPRTAARRTTLSATGTQVNCAAVVDGLTVNYGFRSLAKLTVIPHWWDLSGSRAIMALRARVASLDEQFVFAQLDGKGQTISRYDAAVKGVCKELYDLGALYGDTPSDAYQVDTGPAVTTTNSDSNSYTCSYTYANAGANSYTYANADPCANSSSNSDTDSDTCCADRVNYGNNSFSK
jgi:hypothetical protein